MKTIDIPCREASERYKEWLDRAALSISGDTLMRAMVDHLLASKGHGPAMDFIGAFTGHGTGLADAIVLRFRTPREQA